MIKKTLSYYQFKNELVNMLEMACEKEHVGENIWFVKYMDWKVMVTYPIISVGIFSFWILKPSENYECFSFDNHEWITISKEEILIFGNKEHQNVIDCGSLGNIEERSSLNKYYNKSTMSSKKESKEEESSKNSKNIDKKVVESRKYTFQTDIYEDGTVSVIRINDGFTVIELLGSLEIVKQELIMLLKESMITPTSVTKTSSPGTQFIRTNLNKTKENGE